MGRRRFRRRRRSRFRRRRSRKVTVNRSLQPYAQRYICRLKYQQNVVITGPGCLEYQFNLNSVWDPDLSGVGHQPYGYDQLAAIYNRYRVIATAWRITCVSSASNYYICTYPANDLVTVNNINRAGELPRAVTKVVTPNDTITTRGRIAIPGLVGRTKQQYMADDRYQSLISSNPQEQCVLRVFTQACLGPTDNMSGILNVTLVYLTEFFDMNTLNQS